MGVSDDLVMRIETFIKVKTVIIILSESVLWKCLKMTFLAWGNWLQRTDLLWVIPFSVGPTTHLCLQATK